MNDLEITTLVKRLARAHPSGGIVIERAAILAAGADYPAIMDWITAHAGTPETTAPTGRSRGLHGSRINGGNVPAPQQPMRFVLPADALRTRCGSQPG
jgi:hypothetical protein